MNKLSINRTAWKKFKDDNNLSNSSFFSKADVGPTIDSFQKASEKFLNSRGMKDLLALNGKARDMKKAFAKFIGLKEAKAELTATAKSQVEKWLQEVTDIEDWLALEYAKNEKKLKTNDVLEMDKTFDKILGS
jgi:hypothetical protein